MELFEFESQFNRLNKALGILKKEYGVVLSDETIHNTIQMSQRRLNWMCESLQDGAHNPKWVRESMLCKTASEIAQLLEAKQQGYRIDPKTGALLNFVAPENGDINSVAARPDLYWRDTNSSTTDIVVPPAMSAKDMRTMGLDPSYKPAEIGTGVYVGVDTPGAQAPVINGKKGESRVRVASLDKNGVVKTKKEKQASAHKKEKDANNDMIFNKGKKKSKFEVDVTSPISGKEDKKMKESANKSHIFSLMESEIEKAQIVMAVQNEIVDKLQRDAEKIANMKIDVLGPIVDRIKAEHGLDAAEAFRDLIASEIDQALDAVMQVKDRINTETLKLTGDISSAPDVEQDLGAEPPMDSFDMEADFTTDEPELDAEPIPAEREVKESRKLGIVVETTKGKTGRKFFESVEQMRGWVQDNKEKIKKINRLI